MFLLLVATLFLFACIFGISFGLLRLAFCAMCLRTGRRSNQCIGPIKNPLEMFLRLPRGRRQRFVLLVKRLSRDMCWDVYRFFLLTSRLRRGGIRRRFPFWVFLLFLVPFVLSFFGRCRF